MKEVVDISGPINELGQREGVGHWLKVFGPGLIVMLADTDAGCLITAAQSGAQWGYAMASSPIVAHSDFVYGSGNDRQVGDCHWKGPRRIDQGEFR